MPLDTGRFRAFLEEARLIKDQDGIWCLEVLKHVLAQVITHDVCLPPGGEQQPLDTEWGTLADVLGDLPTVLAFDWAQERVEIRQGTLTLFTASKMRGNALVEPFKICQPAPRLLSGAEMQHASIYRC
ncbi:hypothetical protein GCM10010840_30350 [Deinococcus aerolatus]|uniref:Uncharacterized protein n=1 Tax=Deinococcus aerolatus TaxID=522487 RepID=A0ABQ2GDU6_9DEIO|nr:hypothetical protein GCM10010840_30350 [Deinococcus aerolatus]